MSDIVLHLAVSALYGGLALHFWRTRWKPREHPHGGMAAWERARFRLAAALGEETSRVAGSVMSRLAIAAQAAASAVSQTETSDS